MVKIILFLITEALYNSHRSVTPKSKNHKVKPIALFQRFCRRNALCLRPWQTLAGRLSALQAHSCPCSLNNSLSGHPQIARGKQRDHLRRFLDQPSVGHLVEVEPSLYDSDRVFDLGAHAGLELLGLVQQTAPRPLPVQRPALARLQGQMPVDFGGRRRLGCALLARISKRHRLLTMQRALALGRIVDVVCGIEDDVNQRGIGISANVRLHATVPLITLFGLVRRRLAPNAAVFKRKGGASVLARMGFRIKEGQQITPRRNSIHLGQQITLSRDFGGQLKSGGDEAFLSLHHSTGAEAAKMTYIDLT